MDNYILVSDFCACHEISHTFLVTLDNHGLVRLIEKEKTLYLPLEELPKTEKILRLHNDLNINMEGVEVVTRLLDRLAEMQQEMNRLRNKLRLYE